MGHRLLEWITGPPKGLLAEVCEHEEEVSSKRDVFSFCSEALVFFMQL